MPADWIEATRNGMHGPDYNLAFPEGSYRNQFWIEDPRSRTLMCRGVFGQLIYISWETQHGRGEALDLAGFRQSRLCDGDDEGDPCDRGGAGVSVVLDNPAGVLASFAVTDARYAQRRTFCRKRTHV